VLFISPRNVVYLHVPAWRQLCPGPVTKREIVDRTGLSDRQVGVALQRLRQSGRVSLLGQARSRNARWRRTETYGEG
jgi:hypothetical protein